MDSLADPRHNDTIERYFEAVTKRNRAAWLALFDDDAVGHDPVGTDPAEGRDAIAEMWQVLSAPFESLEIRPDDVFHAGSGAAVKWSADGTAAGGASAEFEGITVFEFAADGRIQTLMAYWDPAEVLIRLADGD